jgi:myo-inositol-1(or 4)-monophosphatase
MGDATQETLQLVLAVAREAGRIQLERRGERPSEVEKDGGASFATAVDYACEQVILDTLRPRFPHHRFIAEESGAAGAEAAEYTWAIDPLDGTIAYVSSQPYFAVSIGLLWHDEPVLGVVHLPAFGRTYWALRGEGAFRDGTPIHVSAQAQLRRALLGFDLPDLGARADELRRLLLPVADAVRFAYVFGGAAANLAFVAEGTLDGYAHIASIWDFAAGGLLVEEAGGRVSDFEGRPLDWSRRRLDLVATNGGLHAALHARLPPGASRG